MSTALRLAEEAKSILDAADRKNRPLTTDERVYVDDLLERAQEHHKLEKSVHEMSLEMGCGLGGPTFTDPNAHWAAAGDPGTQFIQSAGYKAIADPSQRGARWSTGMIEITSGPPLQRKGTLGETGGWGGDAFVATPQVVPGIVPTLFQPLAVEQCFGAALSATSTVRYVTQSTAINAAAGVAEGALKPESTLGFDYADAPIKKVATFLPLSDEVLEDAPAIQQFVNAQLTQFVQLEVDAQLLYGPASSDEVQGLLVSRGVPIYTGSTATDGNIGRQLFKGMNSMRGSAYIEPEFALMSVSDYETLRLLEDSNGQLYGGGPLLGPYGVGAPISASGQITGATDQVWGKPCYVTNALGPGTALVGARAGATVFSRGGLRVEASNAHSDFFQLNLTAIRAERRLGLAVYRSNAFVEVRFGT